MNKSQPVERASDFRGGTEISICPTEVPEQEGDYALHLMTHLAIAAAIPDGEDTAGRQKLRLMTPQEVVDRACEISKLAFQQFQAREWTLKLPLPQPPKKKDEL
jgi:hypothetical protein